MISCDYRMIGSVVDLKLILLGGGGPKIGFTILYKLIFFYVRFLNFLIISTVLEEPLICASWNEILFSIVIGIQQKT